ncbi:MAG: energy transducer TonB [Blastocatellia bacterium]
MKGRIWPIAFCVCVLAAISPIHLSQERESTWPCKDDPNLLRDENGKPVLFPAKELGSKINWYERPTYPRACRCSGSVQVLTLINTEGDVECFQYLSGHPLLRAPISEALMKWRFQPVEVKGKAVSVSSVITFNFTDTYDITDSVTLPQALPCETNARLLKDDKGNPIWIGPKEMGDRAVYKVDPYRDPHLNASSTVFVDLLVNEDGKVVCATVPNGHPVWRSHAISAAIEWRFQPMIEGGRKVSYLGRLLFTLTRD